MAVELRISLEGQRKIQNALRTISPKFRPQILRVGLTKAGLLIQDEAASRQIAAGGREAASS